MSKNRTDSSKLTFSLQKKFILSILLVVTPMIGLTFVWTGIHNRDSTMIQIVKQAQILSRQIILTRQWISDCEGVMVLNSSQGGEPDTHFLTAQIQTEYGTFNRFTPSMVTRKLSEYSFRENLYHFRLAGLSPMNPENRPDDFEKKALMDFMHQNKTEVYTLVTEKKENLLRYTVPLHVDKTCMECHADFHTGSVAGCLSIFLPCTRVIRSLHLSQIRLACSGSALIFLTTLALFFLLRNVVIKPVSQLKFMADEIKNDNLGARVDLKTKDEFELLGRSFNSMGQKLARNRERMEEKIQKATADLSDANKELTKHDRLKTEFIEDMSHELRSPVTAVKGGLDYLMRTTRDKKSKSCLEMMDNNLLRMANLVNDMLDLTRIEAGKVVWEFETYDMTTLILELIEILSLKAASKNLTLTFDRTEPLWVEMDIERMEQVLVNIIENAVKFSPPDSTIRIHARPDKNWCLVSITDSGPGISRDNLKNIFKKFRTLPSNTKDTETKGTGLGLTISRRIISAHGGKIRADSEEGKGSTFTFKLPLKHK